uniref:Small VCP/p97-interacting protein n=1 Tax=Timema poppense TaxID=170557 RepID=A0A7R9HCW9_TIMPO|nr:unnamed protein product [Timema poppensis]
MGICSSCFKNSSTDFVTPDMRFELNTTSALANYATEETRRQQQAAAAEKRLQEQDSRGIKNVDKVRRQQQRKEEMERREEEAAKQGGQGGLKVTLVAMWDSQV